MEKNKQIILIVGHGSRVRASNEEFERFVTAFSQYSGKDNIRPCYVELAKPDFKDALTEAAGQAHEVIVLPLFLFAAGHVKNDIPLVIQSVRNQYPQVRIKVARPLGVHPGMVRLTAKRLQAASLNIGKKDEETAVLMIGRGSSDPDANGDFCKVVRLLEETTDFNRAAYSFIAIVRPKVAEALDRVVREKPGAVILQPYLLFSGRLVEQMHELIVKYKEDYPWISFAVAEPLGEDPLLFDLLLERMNDIEEQRPLPCDACQYRIPLKGFEKKVGGLNALLWSARHSFTHNQAMPHQHAHAPVKKHILVCGNVDCVDQGSIKLIEKLRTLIKEKGLTKEILVTRTSCMGKCGEGPTVAVYPDGIWYRGCDEKYAQSLLENHLLNGQLLPEIVDHIMQ